jgi:hypothetical protein
LKANDIVKQANLPFVSGGIYLGVEVIKPRILGTLDDPRLQGVAR